MKTYAPKGLAGDDLRPILDELHATPAQVAQFLRVTERSVWRWLSDGSAPYAALAALWHETPTGRHVTALDVGNELVIHRGLAQANGDALARESARLARLVAISDTGAGNDPFFAGPSAPPPSGGRPRVQAAPAPAYLRLRN
jgi:hypothetical protein